MARTDFLGIEFDDLSHDVVIAHVATLSQSASFKFVVTPNVDHIVRLASEREDGPIHLAHQSASLILCDSRILRGLAKLCGTALSLVPGSDLTDMLLKTSLKAGDRVAIIGGNDQMLDELCSRFPGPRYYQHIPPMGFIENSAACEQAVAFVEGSKAHYTLLAVGYPQSERLAHLIKTRGRATGVGLCIGASIEFSTARKRRAPLWMQRANLEWLFRLLAEPRRLWRRYLVEGPKVFGIVIRWRLTGKGV